MVVVCVVYCDCDLTALLYLLSEVCVCVFTYAAECTPAQANAFVSWQRKRRSDHTNTTVTSPSPSCWWISSQAKQESKHTDGPASSYSRCRTMLEFNYSILCFRWCVDGYRAMTLALSFLVSLTCWHRNWDRAHAVAVSCSCWHKSSRVPGTWTGSNLCGVCISYIRMCVSAAQVSALQSLSLPTHLKRLIKDSWQKKRRKKSPLLMGWKKTRGEEDERSGKETSSGVFFPTLWTLVH